MIRAVIFDFGGVLAEEGFRLGLTAIARRHRIDTEEFFALASDAIYETGYVTGRGTESDYWEFLRRRAGITGDDPELTGEILRRFRLRPRMLSAVRELRGRGFVTAILSAAFHNYACIRAPLHPVRLRCAPCAVLHSTPQSRALPDRRIDALGAVSKTNTSP